MDDTQDSFYADGVQIGQGSGGMRWAAVNGTILIANGVLTLGKKTDNKSVTIASASLSDVDVHLSKFLRSGVWVTMRGRKYSVSITPYAYRFGGAIFQIIGIVKAAKNNKNFVEAFERLSGKQRLR